MILLILKEMKKLIITSILALLITGWSALGAQDWPDEYLGLPGDNLNLYAVMKLFQESETLEGFERSLNDENSRINNLDLNGDNMVDYITISDYVDGNVHNIVLRVLLTQNESQDVAVFTVEQFRNGEVQIQLIGDEALYGRNYIIEPIYAETPNPGYMGTSVNRANVTVVTTSYYDIAAWPMIRYIYHPSYVVWHSSWYWGYYPSYWNPWRSYYWHFYYGYHYNWYSYYYMHYRHWNHFRYKRYNNFYCSRIRTYSPIVEVNINKGRYRSTYSRPEQRRDGEALYASTRDSRRTNDSTADRYGRNSSQGQSTATTRRATTTTTQRTVAKPSASRNASTSATRRTRTTAAGKSTANRSATNSSVTTRRATTTATQSTAATRSKSSAVSGRSASRPVATVKSKEPARSSRSSVSTSSNTNRRSNQVKKSTNTANKSSNARESKTGSTRRK